MSLKFEFYKGVVLAIPDPLNLGRYKVHVPELHLRLPPTEGHWFRNRIHSYRISPNAIGTYYGSYMPLQAGTNVLVSVSNGEWNNGAITQIISDDEVTAINKVMPFGIRDRDDYYLLIQTSKYDSIISITEDTLDQPAKSLHIYHNGTTIILNRDGVHINAVSQNVSLSGNCNINVAGSCNIQSGGPVNVKTSSTINMDGSSIYLNSGTSSTNAGYNTFPATKELRK